MMTALPAAPVRPRTILAIDDDADVREILQIVLEEAGYEVACAIHGDDALRQLNDGLAPHLILLDLMMPVMNGWDFWDAVHSSPRFSIMPIVVLTASGLTTGCIGTAPVLPKPVSHDQLIATIAANVAWN